jgi:hypothetical protein
VIFSKKPTYSISFKRDLPAINLSTEIYNKSFKKDLPPAFPVVLYNGQPKWTAKHEMAVLKWVMVHLKKNYPTINITPVENIIKEPSMLAQNVENWKREIYAEGELRGELRGKLEGKLEQAIEMIREFNLSVELVAERCHLSISELKERLKQTEK